MTFKRDNINRVSVARKLINMPRVSQEKNVHLWLMPVLQRGSSIKVGDMDFTSSWFFPSSFAPLGRSSYPGTKEAQDLAAFLFGSNSLFLSQRSKTIKFQGEEICNGEFDTVNMPAMLNTINFMYLCYSLMPVLQWNSSIKVVFFPFPIQGVGWT